MPAKRVPMAIAYDFDGTLSPKNMQEYDFIPTLNMKPADFWADVQERAKEQNADPILAYMVMMLERARAARIPIRRTDFADYGKSVELFAGVEEWFRRIRAYAKTQGIDLRHYIISSGLREMIDATPIGKEFEAVYASGYMYDQNDVAEWPALAVNYTTKTQYLFRINKGSPNVWDNSLINAYQTQDERPVPFSNMIFVGDGETDVPCMRLVKDQGGHSIAVYRKGARGGKGKAEQLVKEGRVNFIAPGDYTAGSTIDQQVKAVIDKVATAAAARKLMG